MPRQLRLEYPGAIYHVMNRGDHREPIFKDDLDRQCQSLRGSAAGIHCETTVTLQWIAGELRPGKWTYLSNNLSKPTRRSPAR